MCACVRVYPNQPGNNDETDDDIRWHWYRQGEKKRRVLAEYQDQWPLSLKPCILHNVELWIRHHISDEPPFVTNLAQSLQHRRESNSLSVKWNIYLTQYKVNWRKMMLLVSGVGWVWVWVKCVCMSNYTRTQNQTIPEIRPWGQQATQSAGEETERPAQPASFIT